MRLSTPCSRRKVRFIASALNVVDITLKPAMPGTMTFRLSWLPPKMAPKSARNSSGRKKLKNAADGLRQNIRRSRRYWCHARTAESVTRVRPFRSRLRGGRAVLGHGAGRQLEIDILEGRAGHREVAQAVAARERRARELVQQGRRVLRLARGERAVLAPPGDPVSRRARAER